MIKTRLIGQVPSSKKYIAFTVLAQWIRLCANIVMMFIFAHILELILGGATMSVSVLMPYLAGIAAVMAVRYICGVCSSKTSFLASAQVKKVLRGKMYKKLTRMGASYHEKVSTSEVLQVFVEGVDQLELYFGKYLPQFFFAMLAPITLFAVLAFVSLKASLVLLVCVPLIPLSIVAVQKIAKRLLSKYWGVYVNLGDTFLENIQGLTTLKVYQADERKNVEMNEKAEEFRRITMKVLTMQLNSVSVMDIVAYAGSAVGVVIAVFQAANGTITLPQAFLVIMLAADFFLPLRLLGSYFHIAMNGAASAEKIFRLLSAQEPEDGEKTADPADSTLALEHVTFGYEKERTILHDVSLTIPQGSFVSLVGESGCGKSTIAAILSGARTATEGEVTLGGIPVSEWKQADRLRLLTLVPHNAAIFKGTVEANLRMARPDAAEAELWAALEQVNLADFCRSQSGLATALHEGGSNLSGGQRQRLAMARALLHDSPIYVFDEATSNVDAESENDIMKAIHSLAGKKTVILISHRLANVVDSDCIYVLEAGRIAEQGTHNDLLAAQGVYSRLYNAQKQLEDLGEVSA